MSKLEKFVDRHIVGIIEIFSGLGFYGGFALVIWMGVRSPLEAFAGAFGMLLVMTSCSAYKTFKDAQQTKPNSLSYIDLCSLSIAWQKHTGLKTRKDFDVYCHIEDLKEEARK